MEMAMKRPSVAASKAPVIRAEGFGFCYPQAEGESPAAIGPIDWTVGRGDFMLLVGGTGSGKTTLLRCLTPALSPEGRRAGKLEVFGQDPRACDAAESARLVGYVSQSPDNQLVCDTVWHEMAFGLESLGVPQDEMRRRVAEVAHFFGIEPWFRRRVDSLSGGQRQALVLASVLALRPALLLLDEPTSMLDPVAEKGFLHELFRVNRELGTTVVVATHAPESVAAYATRAFSLEGGRLEERAPSAFAAGALDVAGTSAPRAGLAERRRVLVARDAYVRHGRSLDWVLRGFDLDVREGEVHAVLGGNGSGKSTLLSAVAGLLRVERGSLANELAAGQALLPQSPKALFACDSVEAELGEWQRACGYGDDAVAAMLGRLGLAGLEKRHPYDLSGGQQQLLALAKLLLTTPSLLLLDEPTKGLDADTKVRVAQVLLDEGERGVTTLLATHDLSFAALMADRVTLLFDGEAACTQPAAEFFDQSAFYRPLEDGFARLWAKGDQRG